MSEDDRLLTVGEVARLLTVSIRKIWRDVAAGILPHPVKLGPKTTRWWASEIRRYLQQKGQTDQN